MAIRWPGWARSIRPEHGLLAIGIALSVACSWPTFALKGTDFSWRVALHAAAQAGLSNGSEIAFTYVPLGYLGFPDPFLGWTSALATAATALVLACLAAVLAVSLRRWLPLPLAIAVLLVVMRLSSTVGIVQLLETLVFGLAFLVLRSRRTLPIDLLAVCGGLVGAITLLDKLNAGVASIVIVLVVAAVVGRPWWRTFLAAAGSTVGGILLLWVVTGQRLVDLPTAMRAAVELITGFGGAMSDARSGAALELPLAALALALGVGLVVIASAGWTKRARGGLILVWAVYAGSAVKEGFTRGDLLHNAVFFDAMLLASVILIAAGTAPTRVPAFARSWAARFPRWARSAVTAGTLAILVSLVLAFSTVTVRYLVSPQASITKLVSNVGASVRPWSWDRLAAQSRQRILRSFAVDPSLLAELAGRSVHVDPIDSALAAALPGVRWAPEPVFQSYSAYTPWLDDLNATFLAGPGAPERILRRNVRPYVVGAGRPTTVDDRLLAWEQPAATLEMVCRYRELAISGSWQVLARGADRCGAPSAVATVTAEPGQPVTVPAPQAGQVLIVRVSPLQGGLVERAADFVLGSPKWFAEVDGTRYRLVPGTVGDGLLLALPDSVGWSPAFAFGPPIRTIAILGGDLSPSARLTFEFEAITIAATK